MFKRSQDYRSLVLVPRTSFGQGIPRPHIVFTKLLLDFLSFSIHLILSTIIIFPILYGMLKLFELFEFLRALSFIWLLLIIKDYLVYPCSRLAFLVIVLTPSAGCDHSQG